MIIMKTSAGEAKDGLISEFGFFLSFIANKSVRDKSGRGECQRHGGCQRAAHMT